VVSFSLDKLSTLNITINNCQKAFLMSYACKILVALCVLVAKMLQLNLYLSRNLICHRDYHHCPIHRDKWSLAYMFRVTSNNKVPWCWSDICNCQVQTLPLRRWSRRRAEWRRQAAAVESDCLWLAKNFQECLYRHSSHFTRTGSQVVNALFHYPDTNKKEIVLN